MILLTSSTRFAALTIVLVKLILSAGVQITKPNSLENVEIDFIWTGHPTARLDALAITLVLSLFAAGKLKWRSLITR